MKDLDFANIENWTDPPEEADEDFICPCCGASRDELHAEVGQNKNGKEKNNKHGHHDHISNDMDKLIELGASPVLVASAKTALEGFSKTYVCHRCNAADRGLLKDTFIAPVRPELYDLCSFPPSAIRVGVIRVPGGKHVLHPRAEDLLYPEIQLVIRRAEQAADLVNGIRNATIGAEAGEFGDIINTVLNEFLRYGSPLEIRCEKSGPLSWKALHNELKMIREKTYNHWFPFGNTFSCMDRMNMILTRECL